MADLPVSRAFVELRELKPGDRFCFFADDLPNRGPCTLVEKSPGVAVIRYEPHTVTRTFKARDNKGQLIERSISETLTGESRCSLGAQVVAL